MDCNVSTTTTHVWALRGREDLSLYSPRRLTDFVLLFFVLFSRLRGASGHGIGQDQGRLLDGFVSG